MESECHKLDVELALLASGKEGDRAGFLKHTQLIEELDDLTDEKHRFTQFASMLDGAVTALALQLGDDDEQNPRLLEFRQEAVQARDKIESIVSALKACTCLHQCAINVLLIYAIIHIMHFVNRRTTLHRKKKPAKENLTLTTACFV